MKMYMVVDKNGNIQGGIRSNQQQAVNYFIRKGIIGKVVETENGQERIVCSR